MGPLLAVFLNTALLTHSSSVLAHLVCVDLLSLPYWLWAGHWDNWNNPTPTQQITLSKINCLFWPNYHQLAPEVFPLNLNPLVDKVSTLPIRSPYGLGRQILWVHSINPICWGWAQFRPRVLLEKFYLVLRLYLAPLLWWELLCNLVYVFLWEPVCVWLCSACITKWNWLITQL